MSLVGPRPGLFNQEELTAERAKRGVYNARPGITGLAQVSEIDMSTPVLLAETDQQMIQTLTLANYFKYIFMTVAGKGSGDRRSEEHTSELQSLMRISYAVFCLKKKTKN